MRVYRISQKKSDRIQKILNLARSQNLVLPFGVGRRWREKYQKFQGGRMNDDLINYYGMTQAEINRIECQKMEDSMSKIKITNCTSCFACTKALPQVFSDNKQGQVRINQKEGEQYSERIITGVCPHGNITVIGGSDD